jgi:hypothetical protein
MAYALQPFWSKRNYIFILTNPVSTQKMVSADLAILYDDYFRTKWSFWPSSWFGGTWETCQCNSVWLLNCLFLTDTASSVRSNTCSFLLTLQTAKTKVINSCLNPIWNEEMRFTMKQPAAVMEFVSFYCISHAELTANAKKLCSEHHSWRDLCLKKFIIFVTQNSGYRNCAYCTHQYWSTRYYLWPRIVSVEKMHYCSRRINLSLTIDLDNSY